MLVHRLLLERGLVRPDEVLQSGEAALADLERVPTPEYLHKLLRTGLSADEQRRLGVSWSVRLLRRSRLAVRCKPRGRSGVRAARRQLAQREPSGALAE